MELEGYI